ncbi:uncharacterized protein K460DRAFT_422657, partial [Cucurbitaria berberidis CBS 394.84]
MVSRYGRSTPFPSARHILDMTAILMAGRMAERPSAFGLVPYMCTFVTLQLVIRPQTPLGRSIRASLTLSSPQLASVLRRSCSDSPLTFDSTITTSAASTTIYTSTTRLITTETITKTATTTAPALRPRAANIAAVAEDIIESVIASGTTDGVSSSKNSQRVQAESGLANACSCKMVQPTETVTSSFALPPVTTTVGFRRVIIASKTDTRVFTAVATVTITEGDTAASSTSLSWSQSALNVSSTDSSTSSVLSTSDIIETGTADVGTPTTTLFSRSVLPTSGSLNSSLPVVTALPFSCPGDANKRVDQIVGGVKLDYLVLCNTELVTEDRVGKPIAVESETSCTAQCSLVNAQSGQDTCQGASFTPYTDGRRGGTCTLSGSDAVYVDKPGSVAI